MIVSIRDGRLKDKGEKKAAVLRHNLERAEADCASYDALLAHVKVRDAVIRAYT